MPGGEAQGRLIHMVDLNRQGPKVSVQLAPFEPFADTSIGGGALVAPDEILVPPEIATRFGGDGRPPRLQVILAPAVITADAVIERRTVVSVRRLGLTETPLDADVAILTLDAPSAFPPVIGIGSLDRFRDAIRSGADLWSATELSGALPTGFRDRPGEQWFSDLSDVVDARRPRLLHREVEAIPEQQPHDGLHAFYCIPWLRWLC
jgi:hypothetical protein